MALVSLEHERPERETSVSRASFRSQATSSIYANIPPPGLYSADESTIDPSEALVNALPTQSFMDLGTERLTEGSGQERIPQDNQWSKGSPDFANLVNLLESKSKIAENAVRQQLKILSDIRDSTNASLTNQLEVLKKIDARLDATDSSNKPVTQVSATSPSSWIPLQRSASHHMDPYIDRWKSGLDALLVFIGLFTAVVTAFFVESSKSLQADETKRTNELLANLTEIYIAISSNNSPLPFPTPEPFNPDKGTIRVVVYWTISLVLSISVAALAVACRGFLASLTRSQYKDAARKLTETYTRWKQAERLLGPVVDFIPQIMVFPVLFFIIGFLDLLLTTILTADHKSTSLICGWVVAVACVGIVVASILGFVLHGLHKPHSSPFQSLVSRIYMHYFVVNGCDRPRYQRIRSFFRSLVQTRRSKDEESINEGHTLDLAKPEPKKNSTLSSGMYDVYHEVTQITYDDALLDHSVASFLAFRSFSRQLAGNQSWEGQMFTRSEVDTIVYLLSSEASLRTNLSAAHIIVNSSGGSFDDDTSSVTRLVKALLGAAERFHRHSGNDGLWESIFTKAFAQVAVQTYYRSWFSEMPPLFHLLLWSDLPTINPRSQIEVLTYIFSTLVGQFKSRQMSSPDFNTASDDEWDHFVDESLKLGLQHGFSVSSRDIVIALHSLAYAPYLASSSKLASTSFYSSIQRERQPVVTAALKSIVKWLYRQNSGCMLNACSHFASELAIQPNPLMAYGLQTIFSQVSILAARSLDPTECIGLAEANTKVFSIIAKTLASSWNPLGPASHISAVQFAHITLLLLRKLRGQDSQKNLQILSKFRELLCKYLFDLYRQASPTDYGAVGFLYTQALNLWPDLVESLRQEMKDNEDFSKDYIDPLSSEWQRWFMAREVKASRGVVLGPTTDIESIQDDWYRSSIEMIQTYFVNTANNVDQTYSNFIDMSS